MVIPAYAFVLAVNGGFSSIKFALLETNDSMRACLDGSFERVGLPAATLLVKGAEPANAIPFPTMEPRCD